MQDNAITGATPDSVREFLLRNPAFLTEDPDFLQNLLDQSSAAHGDNVRSLQGVALRRMQRRLDELQSARDEIFDAAQINMEGMAQIHAAVLIALETRDFNEFMNVVTVGYNEILDVDSTEICVETVLPGGVGLPDANGDSSPLKPLRPGIVRNLMREAREGVLLRPPGPETRPLHRCPGDIRSEALVRLDLGEGARPGLLLFGSDDPTRFEKGQAVDLLSFLGGAVERLLRQRLEGTPIP